MLKGQELKKIKMKDKNKLFKCLGFNSLKGR
jgi:hypothetical protein